MIKDIRGDPLKIFGSKAIPFQPAFMHPALFVGSSVLLGALFALQQWLSMRMFSDRIGLWLLLRAWALQYFLWGVLCWLLWLWLGPQLQRANLFWMITRVLPLSIITCFLEEMIWVSFFPNLPIDRPGRGYWRSLAFELNADFFNNMVICWCAVGLFRGIGYYQRYREREDAAAQLEVQLVNAQLSALRMQLNPHFLFNTMNSISSLMRIDVDAADSMLEQLGSLLRITLERGDAQLIPLRDEVEFIEMYLALQDQRYSGRVRQSVAIDPATHDALVPAMILQPVVENAYAHGLSMIDGGGVLVVEAHCEGSHLILSVLNSGIGLMPDRSDRPAGQGVGLTNVKSRLRLHYGTDHKFLMHEAGVDKVQVEITVPLNFSHNHREHITRFGV